MFERDPNLEDEYRLIKAMFIMLVTSGVLIVGLVTLLILK
jgi:hypothetical protein